MLFVFRSCYCVSKKAERRNESRRKSNQWCLLFVRGDWSHPYFLKPTSILQVLLALVPKYALNLTISHLLIKPWPRLPPLLTWTHMPPCLCLSLVVHRGLSYIKIRSCHFSAQKQSRCKQTKKQKTKNSSSSFLSYLE